LETAVKTQAPTTESVENTIDWLYRTSALFDYMRLRFWDSQQLTVTQLRLMGFLRDEEGLSNAELADRLLVTRPSVSALLDRLERGGFIRRETSLTDRRGIRIYLEPRGVEAVTYVRRDARAFARDLLEGLSAEDVEQIGAVMERFVVHARDRRLRALAAQRACEHDHEPQPVGAR
jgi:DNA-binding MarR family transcriptional regulator